MSADDRSCGCHTIYLVKRGDVRGPELDVARMMPGAILTYDNDGAITPMIFHSCGHAHVTPTKKVLVASDARIICETNA